MIRAASSLSLSRFLADVYVPSRLDLCAESVRQMQITIGRFEAWAGRTTTIDDLDEQSLRKFLADYRQSNAASTTNSKRCQLLALWRCAWDEGHLPQPPHAKRIRKAVAPPTIPEAWTADEVGKIITAANQEAGSIAEIPAPVYWRSLVLALYDTGERRGAAFAAQTADLSLSGGWIVYRKTKTKAPRWCPLSVETIQSLAMIFDRRRKLLWPWPYSREWLDKKFKAILAAAGVAYGRARGGNFHKLRKTSGTLVEAAGGNGAKHIGDTRAVFERHYRDPRFFTQDDLAKLPRPQF